jgi:4-amino-4-deoxy-L-arabinose transferase-like glycosyltransferase
VQRARPITVAASPRRDWVMVAGLLALAAALAALFWVGFIASDDATYRDRALGLLSGHAGLPTSHWEFRYPLVWTLVAAIGVFGDSPAVLGGVAMAFGMGLVLLVWGLARCFAGPREAAWAGLLAAASPLVIVSMSTINVDVSEAVLALASLGLFVAATQSRRPVRWMLASGLAAGAAILNRETGLGLLLVYGVLFLRGAYMPRARYLWGGLGAALVVGAEMAWFAAHGESLLYRYRVAASTHDVVSGLFNPDFDTGNLTRNPLLAPPLALLVNQEFGLLYLLAPPAIWSLWRARAASGAGRVFVEVAIVAAMVWFLWIGYGGAVYPLPRYFFVTTALVFILIGMWLARLGNRRLAGVLLALVLAANLFSLSLENTHPRFASQALAGYMLAHPDAPTIHTDEVSARRTALAMQWRDPAARRRFSTEPPGPGDPVFHDPAAPAPAPPPGAAMVLMAADPPKRLVGTVLTALRLDGLVPGAIRQKLVYCGLPAVLYRQPGGATP